MGVDPSRMRKWEQLDYDPRGDDARKIEAFFGCSIDELSKITSLNGFLNVPNAVPRIVGTMLTIPAEQYILKLEKQNSNLEQAILLSLNAIQERQNLAKDQLETFATRMYQMVRVSLDETAEVRATVQKKDPLVVKEEVDRKLTSGLKVGK